MVSNRLARSRQPGCRCFSSPPAFLAQYAPWAPLGRRAGLSGGRPSTPAAWPDISILKPLAGVEAQLSENIETFFHQDYPGAVQFVFGVQDPADSAIPVVKSLIEQYAGRDIQLVVNGAMQGVNRKVSNLINMGQVARHPLIVLTDSDIAVVPNYLRTVAAALAAAGRRGSHLSLPRPAERRLLVAALLHGGARPFLARPRPRAYARAGAAVPWRDNRAHARNLSRIGGFETVANQLADDYAIGKAVPGRPSDRPSANAGGSLIRRPIVPRGRAA